MTSETATMNTINFIKRGDGGCRCKLRCSNRISDEMIMSFVRDFKELKTKDKQDIYLQGLIEPDLIEQRKSREPVPRKQSTNFKYYVYDGDTRIRVCKRVFMSFHGITVKRVRRLYTLLLAGQIPTDKRGRVTKTSEEKGGQRCQTIRDYLDASIFRS